MNTNTLYGIFFLVVGVIAGALVGLKQEKLIYQALPFLEPTSDEVGDLVLPDLSGEMLAVNDAALAAVNDEKIRIQMEIEEVSREAEARRAELKTLEAQIGSRKAALADLSNRDIIRGNQLIISGKEYRILMMANQRLFPAKVAIDLLSEAADGQQVMVVNEVSFDGAARQ